MALDIVYSHPGGRGWGPIDLLAELASRELGARLIRYDASTGYSKLMLARGMRPRFGGGRRKLLVIAPHPTHLSAVLQVGPWLSRYQSVAGWVIDSFWTDRIPHIARGGYFDKIYVTDPDDVEPWQASTSAKVSYLPWGTDALAISSSQLDKSSDLLRVGRQPDTWDDDAETTVAAASLGLIHSGRPPFGKSDLESQEHLNTSLAGARFVLAFSNRVNPTDYTHPTKEYVTARWLDSLANGAVVAGIAPRSAAARDLLWPGACLELGTTDRDDGLQVIAAAAAQWTPAIAVANQQESLSRLDWRHRLRVIAADLDLEAPALDASLVQLVAARATT